MKIPKRMRLLSNECGELATFAPAEEGSKVRRFRMNAYTGAPVSRWFGPMIVNLAGTNKSPKKRPILLTHNLDEIVGHSDKWEVGPDGIFCEGPVSRVTEAGKKVTELADEGFPWQSSIGFEFLSAHWIEKGTEEVVNGRTFKGPGLVVDKSRVYEASFVSAGADGDTESSVLADAGSGEFLEIEEVNMAEKDTPSLLEQFSAKHADQIKQWKDEARAEGVAAERARFAALASAIPNEPAFVAEQFAAGSDVLTAKAAFGDVVTKRLAETNAALSAEREKAAKLASEAGGNPGVTFVPPAPKPASPEAAQAADDKLSVEDLARKRWDANHEGCKEQFAGNFPTFVNCVREERRHANRQPLVV